MKRTFRITVFGGSTPKPGDPAYKQALHLGHLLGKEGYTVLTGGYIGTMEAVSRGAAEVGGQVIGVTCSEIEQWRPVGPNPWVKKENYYPSLMERLFALIEGCDVAIALPGGIGTLAEIAVMWTNLQIGAIPKRPLILVGSEWESTFEHFFNQLGDYVSPRDGYWLTFVPDVETAFQHVQAWAQKQE
ncbi:MAG: LOG family protein [Chloroflexota bacterium]